MHFYKYQGTGNDFILIDNRSGAFNLNSTQIEQLCHRRLSIGADGLMLLNAHPTYDFEMIYFNADGLPGSMCGNGGRCITQFALDLGINKSTYNFLAVDGPHEAEILTDGRISLRMIDVDQISASGTDFILNTGSPHLVRIVKQLDLFPVFEVGQTIRNEERFGPRGINVNFVERTESPELIRVRTYERGVEDETLSCGTGVTACAIARAIIDQKTEPCTIETKGGQLMVRFQTKDFVHFTHIHLIGPATKVFEGNY